MAEKTVTTSFRMSPSFKEQLKLIAKAEHRTTNNWVRMILEQEVERYLAEHPRVPRVLDEQPS